VGATNVFAYSMLMTFVYMGKNFFCENSQLKKYFLLFN